MRATHPPDTQECERIWTHEWKDAFQKIKDHQLLKYFSESGPAEGQGDVQGWVWLFNIAAWSTGDIYEWGTPSGREKVLTDREGIFGCFHRQRA